MPRPTIGSARALRGDRLHRGHRGVGDQQAAAKLPDVFTDPLVGPQEDGQSPATAAVTARLPAWATVTDGIRDRAAAGSRATTAIPQYILGHLVQNWPNTSGNSKSHATSSRRGAEVSSPARIRCICTDIE
ncbi:hypothetical protein [Rhodococcus sp. MALMAid1271]|uniref:hypothetical protein n=1 Tax=Rhodococcus sp. MALMAid1271 TaxID=3411744 RepID=UPI003B9F13CA